MRRVFIQQNAVRTPPISVVVRAGLPIIDEQALTRWLYSVDDGTLLSLVLAPHLPETFRTAPSSLGGPGWPDRYVEALLRHIEAEQLPYYVEDCLTMTLSWAQSAPSLLLAAAAHHAIRVRAIDLDLTGRLVSWTTRGPRVAKPTTAALCEMLPPVREVRAAVRGLLSGSLPLTAGPALDALFAPLGASAIVARVRDPERPQSSLAPRVVDVLRREERPLRDAVLSLAAKATTDRLPGAEPLQRAARLLGTNDHVDDVVAAAVLIRALVLRVGGPKYGAPDWPPRDPFDASTPGRALRWAGATRVVEVELSDEGRWTVHATNVGPPEPSTPVALLDLPPSLVSALGDASIATVEDVRRTGDAELYRTAGVGRNGLLALRKAIPPEGSGPELPDTGASLETLHRYAAARADEAVLARSLDGIPFLSRNVVSELDARNVSTVGELLRWPETPTPISLVLGPRQRATLLADLRAYLSTFGGSR